MYYIIVLLLLMTFWNPIQTKNTPKILDRYPIAHQVDFLKPWGNINTTCTGNSSKNKCTSRHLSDIQMYTILHMEKLPCGTAIQVLSWLLNYLRTNAPSNITPPILAYGGLIHFFREKAFAINGTYIDSDIDLLVLPQTLTYIIDEMRMFLWNIFSWDIKIFTNCRQNIVFAQIVSTCSYQKIPLMTSGCYKERGVEPALELYIILPKNTNKMYLDIWSYNTIDARVLFPTRIASFHPDITANKNNHLTMTLPQHPKMFLKAMYGNWTIKSSKQGLANVYIAYK